MELEQAKTKELMDGYKKIKDFLTYLEKELKTYKDSK